MPQPCSQSCNPVHHGLWYCAPMSRILHVAEALIRRVEGDCGRIDALINCIGAYHRVPLMQESIEGWHAMFDHNLHPVFYLSRAVAPGMIQRGWGRIINFSMVNADQQTAQPFITAHYIAKIGVLVLTRSLARTLAPHGVTANSISPGFIETGGVPPEELAQSFKQHSRRIYGKHGRCGGCRELSAFG